jgi:hypothetical protein
MGLGFCRGLTYRVDNRVDNSYPQVIQLLSTCEQAVGILWITLFLNFCPKSK